MNNKILEIWYQGRNFENIPSYEKPRLLILWGPPASGKSSSEVKSIIHNFGIPMKDYIIFNVDDPVESHANFKRESIKSVNTFLASKQSELNQLNTLLNNINNDNASHFSKPYLNIRKQLNLNKKMDSLIKNALDGKKNIILETTGMRGLGWLLENNSFDKKSYIITIIFPLIGVEDGWRRYKTRAIKSYKAGNHFRFGLTKSRYILNYIQSYKTFINNHKNLERIVISPDGERIVISPDGSNANEAIVRQLLNKATSKTF